LPGYPYGALQDPDGNYDDPFTGNRHAVLGDRAFDVHPFDPVVKGYPIRWELDEYQKANWSQTCER
jgi:hypothetical protein